MRALVIAHDPDSTAVLVGERLIEHGFTLDELIVCHSLDDPTCSVTFPDPAGYDLVVVMGSIWSVYDEATIGSWIGRELELLRQADEARVPILGICFGGQALAAALGGRVEKAREKQIGWYMVESDVPDIASGPWMQWHGDRFEPPPGATVLARDHSCVQAFRIGRNLGLQFHPEVTRSILQQWIDVGGAAEIVEFGRSPQAILDETDANAPTVVANTDRLVDWFLAEVAELATVAP